MDKISIKINGQQYSCNVSQTILEAASDNGIDIPNLCHDPRLEPTGACRMCLVEVEGARGPMTACTTKVSPDMVITTESDELNEMRKINLELLFYEHCGSCTTCDENGNCLMQQYAYQYQVSEDIFNTKPVKHKSYTDGNAGIAYDVNKCIRCGRCIRICDEVQMDNALTFKSRAAQSEVSTAFDMPLNDSTCELCGQCISTCPTGALYEREAIGKGQSKDMDRVTTICPYCGVGCRLDLNINRKTNKIVRVTSEIGCVPNEGNLCVKGRFGMDFVSDPKRLARPLIKRNQKFEEASWDEAIKLVADKFKETKERYGPDSIAGLASAKCTNEDNYVFQKFIRAGIGTNNVDHCARLCHASTVAGLARAFGSGAMTNSIDEIKYAKCIFIIGSNTTEAHPVIGLSVKEAVVKNGAKLIVADPRGIDVVRFSDIHMQQKPGTDVALINGMMNVIINEGLCDEEFIKTRCEDFELIKDTIAEYTPDMVSEITTIDADMIVEAARSYAKAETASIIYSMGITQHTTGTDNVLSLANLAMITGNVGKENAGVNPLRGQNNVQGACDLGALPNVYPGYQAVTDDEINEKFEKAWGCKLSKEIGLTIVEIMHAIEDDKVKLLYIMGENPALSDPNLNRTRKALDSVDFLVVQDIFLTETAQYADVVLPSACFAEKDGTFTNTERRVQRVRKAVELPGYAKEDWQITCNISKAVGLDMGFENASEILDEIASVSPIYGGMSFARIDKVGLQWPCLDKEHPGTKFLHEGQFKRGKGKFYKVDFVEPQENPNNEYPFILSTGRMLYQFHTGTMTRKSLTIDQKSPGGYVEIHPKTAKNAGLKDGQMAELSTVRGKIKTRAMVTDQIAPGWLFIPFHFAEGPANILTNDALDKVAKIPEFKVCAANIRKAT